eukprot:maker-scaffold23_size669530-snap-gene-1.26 protein:Tk11051 transcript:maker-scaffold23_size669530-snap-gene-1.26-mRNA-1 annotation:"5-formyltetrahydrofolate cyclo-ligase-like"
MASCPIKAAKGLLRPQMKAVIKTLSADSKLAQSEWVTKRLLQHPIYRSSQSIAIYLSMADEVDTLQILQDALGSGKQCFVPRYFRDGRAMDMVELRDMADYEGLPLTRWNIKQPAEEDVSRREALDVGLDLVLVPGLAFTSAGHRLGRGKGYYDTYLALAQSRQIQPPKTLALAFQEQVIDTIPTHAHDVLVDEVLYP